MDGRIEQPLTPTLRGLPVARVFFDVRNEPRVEDRFAIVPGVKPTIQVEVRAIGFQIRESGHALQRVQSFWQEHRVCFIDWYNGNRSQHKAIVVDDREDFFALLVFVAGIANTIAALFGYRVGAIAVQNVEIEVAVRRQMPHTGDKCLFERSIVGPFSESFVDCLVMDSRLSVGCPWDRQALPLHGPNERTVLFCSRRRQMANKWPKLKPLNRNTRVHVDIDTNRANRRKNAILLV